MLISNRRNLLKILCMPSVLAIYLRQTVNRPSHYFSSRLWQLRTQESEDKHNNAIANLINCAISMRLRRLTNIHHFDSQANYHVQSLLLEYRRSGARFIVSVDLNIFLVLMLCLHSCLYIITGAMSYYMVTHTYSILYLPVKP